MFKSFHHQCVRIGIMVVTILLCSLIIRAEWLDDIGYTQLKKELGNATPTGAGVHIAQVGRGGPDTSFPQFAGKKFTYCGGMAPGSPMVHANSVANFFYANTGTQTPGITQIDLWDSHQFLTILDQNPNNAKIVNGPAPYETKALRQLDYGIATYHYLDSGSCTWAGNNPQVLCWAGFNGISISSFGGIGKPDTVDGHTIKPDIVGPPGQPVSWAVPMVSSAGALLLSYANAHHQTAAWDNPETVIKAILMAGARKDACNAWSRTPTQPLDLTNGAGMLNTCNSFHILAAGQQAAGKSAATAEGWDFAAATAAGPKIYFFTLATAAPFTAVLAWTRSVNKADWSYKLPHLTLKLYQANGMTPGAPVDQSVSTTDNVQLIYRQVLPAGHYALAVGSDTDKQNYALAWHTATASAAPAASETSSEHASDKYIGTVSATMKYKRPLLTVGTTVYELKAADNADATVNEILAKISSGEATGVYIFTGVQATVNGRTGLLVTHIKKQ